MKSWDCFVVSVLAMIDDRSLRLEILAPFSQSLSLLLLQRAAIMIFSESSVEGETNEDSAPVVVSRRAGLSRTDGIRMEMGFPPVPQIVESSLKAGITLHRRSTWARALSAILEDAVAYALDIPLAMLSPLTSLIEPCEEEADLHAGKTTSHRRGR